MPNLFTLNITTTNIQDWLKIHCNVTTTNIQDWLKIHCTVTTTNIQDWLKIHCNVTTTTFKTGKRFIVMCCSAFTFFKRNTLGCILNYLNCRKLY